MDPPRRCSTRNIESLSRLVAAIRSAIALMHCVANRLVPNLHALRVRCMSIHPPCMKPSMPRSPDSFDALRPRKTRGHGSWTSPPTDSRSRSACSACTCTARQTRASASPTAQSTRAAPPPWRSAPGASTTEALLHHKLHATGQTRNDIEALVRVDFRLDVLLRHNVAIVPRRSKRSCKQPCTRSSCRKKSSNAWPAQRSHAGVPGIARLPSSRRSRGVPEAGRAHCVA